MAHFFKCRKDGNSCLCIEKQGTGFGFGGGGGNTAECFTKDVDGTIGLGIGSRGCCRREIGEKKVTSSTTAGVGKNKVSSIRTNGENHVTSVVPDGGIRVSGKVVKEHVTGSLGFLVGEAWWLEISLRAVIMVGSQQRE